MDWEVIGRLVVTAIIGLVAYLYPRDMRRYRHQWPRRARRITLATLLVFITQGFALLYAASAGLDFIWPIVLLGAAFLILAGALLYAPPDDNSPPLDD